MTGGLLQIISSGKQDIYLTVKPEVTFFKKVFRRHTNFSTELVRITSEQVAEYDNIVTFILNYVITVLHLNHKPIEKIKHQKFQF